MLNQVVLMGRLCEEPELKKTQQGVSVCTIHLAVERDYKDAVGERPCDFPTVICWRATAEFVEKYFHKGSMIAISGNVQTRKYQTKDGKNQYVTEIVAEKVSFTGERIEQTAPQQAASQQSSPQQAAPPQSIPPQETDDSSYFSDDDLPF